MGGHRVGAHQAFQAGPFLAGQAAQAIGSDVPAACGGNQGGGVADVFHQPVPPEAAQRLVGRHLGHAGHGGQFQPVQEGHGRQRPQRLLIPFRRAHPPSSPAGTCSGASSPRRRCCLLRSRSFFPAPLWPDLDWPEGLAPLPPEGAGAVFPACCSIRSRYCRNRSWASWSCPATVSAGRV